MWIYIQSTGELLDNDGHVVGVGYAGHGEGRNNPAMQADKYIGPLPCGRYTIGPPHDTDKHGPYVLALTPFAGTEMFSRDDMLMHGDNIEHPGTASLGCVVMARSVREKVWNSGDHILEVVAYPDLAIDPEITV